MSAESKKGDGQVHWLWAVAAGVGGFAAGWVANDMTREEPGKPATK